ncbi:proprotein convertase P-domain-containing protein, partial [Rhizobium sp. BK538]|uniref:proprotein convertase P-domain-containing protein n=1 Tax=Rhizobium sp. BK538 TaxID=2586984 RepID=UPI00161FA049
SNSENTLSLTFNYTATDSDADTASNTFTVNVVDDVPVSTGAIINISIDEDMAGSSITGSLEALVSTGADGVGRYGVDLNTLSPSLTSLTSNGVALAYTVVDNTLIAKAGLATIFTFAVNAQTGAYTFTQVGALDNVDRLLINGHAITPATALDTPGSHFALADVGGSNLAFEGRLADGDAIIRVTNDSNTDRTWTLDNHSAGPDYVLNIPAHTTWYVNVGNVADSTKFDLDGSGAPNGNTVVNPGHGDNIVAIDSDTSLALDLSSTVTVTDGDGDSVALNGQLIVTINDDVPVATGAAQTVTLSETALPVVDVDFASLNINIGADSKNTHIEIGRDGNGNPIINNDLTSDGVPLEYLVRTANGVDQEIVAFKAGDTADHPVFIVSVLHPGSFAATLFQNLDHPADSDNISLNLVARVFDGDGDYVDQPLTINVADSAPTLVANTTVSGDVVEGGSTLETHSFASGAVNLAIPDVSTITSTITVPAGGSIHDVNVSIDLTHTFMADLEITLIAPDGTRVRLVDDNGGGGDPNGTIKFDDEAASFFTAATQPYAGTWRPAIDQLSLFDGKSMAGTWTLEIRDDLGADVGTLRNWSLEIEASHDVSSDTIDLSSLVSVGADDANGAAVFALKTIATAENLGTVTAGGQQVKVISDGTTLTGYAEGAPATPLFTLTVSAHGTATFTMHGEFDHAAGSDNLSLDLSAYVQAFDGDHDAVTLGTGQFVINVADSLPTAIDVAAAMSENESKSITLTEGTHYTFGADVTGAALSLGTPSYTGVPAGLVLGTPSITLGADGHTISIVPGTAFDGLPAGQTAALHIPYTVTDGDHDAVTKDIAVTITGTNDAPVVSGAVTGAATEDGTGATLDALASASDVDAGTILSVTGVPGTLPAGVIYDAATHSFTLDPSHSAYQSLASGQTTTVTVNYGVSDGTVSTPASVSWTVTGTNDAPTAVVLSNSAVNENAAGAVIGTLTTTDPDAGATHSYTVSDSRFEVVNGVLKLVNGVSLDYEAGHTVNLTVTATDQGGLSKQQAFTIQVGDVNEAPVITSGTTGSEPENTAVSNVVYQAIANDPEGATLIYSLTGADAALFNISSSGAVTFKSSPNFEAPADANHDNVYSIVVNAGDGVNPGATKAVAISVTDINEAPSITSGATGSEAENTATSNVVYQTVANDPEGAALTYSLTGADADLFNISSTGAVTFKSSPNFEAPADANHDNAYNIVVNASDGVNPAAAKAVVISVTDVNELAGNANTYDIGKSAGANAATALNLNDSAYVYVKSNDPDIQDASTSSSITISAKTQQGEYDYYKFVVTENGTKVVLDIDHSNFDNSLTLFKASGPPIASTDDAGGDAGSTGNLDAAIVATLDAGTYYVRVSEYSSGNAYDQFKNSSGQYELHVSFTKPNGDPIILDLDHNGVALTSLDNGVQFDINVDGHKDQIAWTAGSDGILALDVDGNGKIDNGSEIFSPHFAGGTYVDGLAALATLDSNHDGKIDAADATFSKLTVWQDLNHNGITDSGELSRLADHSISSISLDATASNSEINGQSILADGSYTLTDGSAGHFVEVAFDTTLGDSENGSNAYSLIGNDGDDTLSGSGGMFTISGGAGADTFVLDADALNDVKLADVITDFKAGEGDTLDVSKLLDSLLGHEATEAEALASIKTTVSGTDTVVSVNANGGWHDVAVLQNTTEAVKILFDDKHDTTTAPHVG